MKIGLFAAGLCAVVFGTTGAFAQDKKVQAQPQATTHATAQYVERQEVDGSQVVSFGGDELPADGPNIYGGVVTRPPSVIKNLLIRPRMNFVPELLKSVENL
jgi:hypothetical protein